MNDQIETIKKAIIAEMNRDNSDVSILNTLTETLNQLQSEARQMITTSSHVRVVYENQYERQHNKCNYKAARNKEIKQEKRRKMPEPTLAVPGTEEKLRVLEERFELGYNLWHKDDCTIENVMIIDVDKSQEIDNDIYEED